MRVRPGTGRDAREARLYRWYRLQLRRRIPSLVAEWETKLGVRVAEWRLRRMKTRWGTCNCEARRIWLNTELAKKPIRCLEYVVVHEMVHLIERSHNERFRTILDRVLPGWRQRLDELNSGHLADEGWEECPAFGGRIVEVPADPMEPGSASLNLIEVATAESAAADAE